MIRYPKVFKTRDGRVVLVRPATADDLDRLLDFFQRLPEEDRLYLRVDVTQRDIMVRRMNPPEHWSVLRLVPLFGEKIVGEAVIAHRAYGFESHVGEVRISIDPEFRRCGLATFLGHQIIAHAIVEDLEKLQAEIMDTQTPAIRCFEKLGFEKEGELKDFVKDIKGRCHNLLIMSLRT